MRLDLPYPAKELWPNGRAHWATKSRATAKHKAWAANAAAGLKGLVVGDGPVPIAIEVCAHPTGPFPDRDNVVAACKSYLDGIAARLGINDRHFAAPSVTFSDLRSSRFIITIGAQK